MALGWVLFAKGWLRALGATLASVGLSLLSVVMLIALVYGFFPFSGVVESTVLLLGIPPCVFAVALAVLLRRSRTKISVSALCAIAGLASLYWLGGIVLMQSACSFHSGGC